MIFSKSLFSSTFHSHIKIIDQLNYIIWANTLIEKHISSTPSSVTMSVTSKDSIHIHVVLHCSVSTIEHCNTRQRMKWQLRIGDFLINLFKMSSQQYITHPLVRSKSQKGHKILISLEVLIPNKSMSKDYSLALVAFCAYQE